MTKSGLTTKGYRDLRKELEPVETKTPKGFSSKEWKLLPAEDKLDFVRAKKDAFLSGFKKRLDSPVLSLMNDIQSLDVKMQYQELLDDEKDTPISPEYLNALRLKVDLAKALKVLAKRDDIKSHAILVRKIDEDEIIDIDPSVFSATTMEEEQ